MEVIIAKVRETVVYRDARGETVVTFEPRTVVVDSQQRGRQGPPGPEGPPGIGDKNYVFDQGIPSDTWVIVHALNKYPAVSIVDSEGYQVEGDIDYDNLQQVTLTFAYPFSGRAFCN